jgi:hypothetical protein
MRLRSSPRRAAQGPPVALLRVWQPSTHCAAAVRTQHLVVWRLVINQQRWLRLELDVGDMSGLSGDLPRTSHQCRAHPSCAHPPLTPQREGLQALAVSGVMGKVGNGSATTLLEPPLDGRR